MDIKQLFNDIVNLNFGSFNLRWNKFKAVAKRKIIFANRKKTDHKKIPIIINNRNRLTYMLRLITWLEKNDYKNIYIIDNDSSYPPLLEYYKSTPYKVFRLKENSGHLALWKTGIFKLFQHDYYVYTDPDVVPVEECPSDVLSYFVELLNKYDSIEKVGFGLKIDDLPLQYEGREKVIDWEKKYWLNEVEKNVFDSELDTTFALYRPYTNGAKWVQKAFRTGGKYVARHLPWYENSSAPAEEDIYYKNNVRAGASHWIPADKKN
jgi:hypothetical protein